MGWFGNLRGAKTVREFIQPSGARITFRLGRFPTGRQFSVERQVNGGWQQQSYGISKGGADRRIRDWSAFEERAGSDRTTDKYERTHCPWCGQKVKVNA